MSKFSDMYLGGKPEPTTTVATPAVQMQEPGLPAVGEGYSGYDFSRNGRPVMGFSIVHTDGTLHGVMYHSINHPKFQVRDGQEFLTFTYSGSAVTMTGSRLRLIFDKLMQHTLKAIYEHDGRQPASTDTPIVTRVSVKQAVPMRVEGGEGLELVKPQRQA